MLSSNMTEEDLKGMSLSSSSQFQPQSSTNIFKTPQTVFNTPETQSAPKMTHGRNIIRCPKCGFTFDISYGRAFACGGCASVVQCGNAKCPKCGQEFPLPGQYGKTYGKYAKSPRI
jgi:uncharacterized C2H2 Zn-finger protein